ncbi:MAG: nucleotide exchange factor GrpE [Limimaricola soesokkakensis]|uniref:nucleotide exchange factor GrpE n=1 Tax=Limimaricola soesokkakensis TaxID=1343159 RepID=UPI00405898AC
MEGFEDRKNEFESDTLEPETAAASQPEPSDGGEGHAAHEARIAELTDRWKRAMAEAENARKRAEAARIEGRDHGIALAIEALAPGFDALALGIEAARSGPDAKDKRVAQHLEGLERIRSCFDTAMKALDVRIIAPDDAAFDPAHHEAIDMQVREGVEAGRVLVLHRPGYAIGRRLIRPARVTVSAAPEPQEG